MSLLARSRFSPTPFFLLKQPWEQNTFVFNPASLNQENNTVPTGTGIRYKRNWKGFFHITFGKLGSTNEKCRRPAGWNCEIELERDSRDLDWPVFLRGKIFRSSWKGPFSCQLIKCIDQKLCPLLHVYSNRSLQLYR